MEVVWGIAMLDNMGWLYWSGVMLVVCNIMGSDSDGSSEYEEWFEGGRQIVCKDSVVGVGGFPFLLSLLVLFYSKASYDFETASIFCLVLTPSKWTSNHLSCFPISHHFHQYYLHPTPPVTLEWVLLHRTQYWMCPYSATGCKCCSEPCSVSCWVYLAPNRHWIHICDNCVDKVLWPTGFDIHQYPLRSPYSNAPVQQ